MNAKNVNLNMKKKGGLRNVKHGAKGIIVAILK